MRKYFFTLIAISFLGLGSCSSTIDLAMNPRVDVGKKMKKIAVFPFDVKGAQWGDEFSDAITHHFFKSGRVDVVEREAIQKILKEQRMTASGLLDESQAVKLGKMLGADVILIGRGSALRRTINNRQHNNLIDTFSLKAINVDTGNLLFTVRKEPGIAWTGCYRAQYCLTLTLIGSDRILVKSTRYDNISKQVVSMILNAIDQIEIHKKPT